MQTTSNDDESNTSSHAVVYVSIPTPVVCFAAGKGLAHFRVSNDSLTATRNARDANAKLKDVEQRQDRVSSCRDGFSRLELGGGGKVQTSVPTKEIEM